MQIASATLSQKSLPSTGIASGERRTAQPLDVRGNPRLGAATFLGTCPPNPSANYAVRALPSARLWLGPLLIWKCVNPCPQGCWDNQGRHSGCPGVGHERSLWVQEQPGFLSTFLQHSQPQGGFSSNLEGTSGASRHPASVLVSMEESACSSEAETVYCPAQKSKSVYETKLGQRAACKKSSFNK